MKKIYYILKITLCYFLVGFITSACSKDENIPTTLTPEVFSSEWSRLEIRFTEGHSHGYFHGSPEYPTKYLKIVQRFYFDNIEGNIIPASDNPTAIRWQGTYEEGQALSGVELIFYNKEGKRINSLLSTGEAPKHYQFFYVLENIVGVEGNTRIPSAIDAVNYSYRDTNPEDLYISGGTYDKNPDKLKGELRSERIGLKGFFTIKSAYINFNLRVILGYFENKPNEQPYFSVPENKVLELSIPVHIYTDLANEDSNEEKAIEDAMREFNVSREEIQRDYDIKESSDINPESSTLFL